MTEYNLLLLPSEQLALEGMERPVDGSYREITSAAVCYQEKVFSLILAARELTKHIL